MIYLGDILYYFMIYLGDGWYIISYAILGDDGWYIILYDILYTLCDVWYIIYLCDMWYMIYYILYVMSDGWFVTNDINVWCHCDEWYIVWFWYNRDIDIWCEMWDVRCESIMSLFTRNKTKKQWGRNNLVDCKWTILCCAFWYASLVVHFDMLYLLCIFICLT